MKHESIEAMKQTLNELIEENKRLEKALIGQRQFMERSDLGHGVTGAISVDDVGEWYPSIEWQADGMTITIAEGHFSNRTLAKHKCEELYREYCDMIEPVVDQYLRPETRPNANVHPTLRPVVNSFKS